MLKYLSIAPILFFVSITYAQDSIAFWPKQIQLDKDYVLTIYTPEPEKIQNNILNARAAFSLYDNINLPIFGAMWFRCRVHTDVAKNQVFFEDIELINANFPNANAEVIEQLQALIAKAEKNWSFNTNLKLFYEKKAILDNNAVLSENLQNTPPKIYYSKVPATLVSIDGDPILSKVNGSELYQYVVNTQSFIVQSSSDNIFYMTDGIWWYMSADLSIGWKSIETPPGFINQLAKNAPQLMKANAQNAGNSAKAPKLIVSNEPAELIQTDGEPEISQGFENIFVVTNSEDEILYDSYTDYYFILISGRWYKTKNLERGTWIFEEPEQLPVIFNTIPTDSPLAHIRMSVPGTPEAISAALDNAIPQTAIVDRNTATMALEFDGEPQFSPIEGTKLKYGVNTPGSVIQDEKGQYFAVDQAIWFTSENALGPWKVADHYPADVRNIPANCPVFNIKFVYIYDIAPDVVYTGYTPSYTGSFLYHGVVYYGTGYRYKSWYGSMYIPGPYTYGYGTKPKKKSNVNVYVSYGYGYGGYGGYGYGGYGYGMGQTYVNPQFFMNQTQVDPGEVERKSIDPNNIYNNRSVGILKTETARRNDPMKPVILIDGIPQQMYATKEGKLYSQDGQGNWYERMDNSWQKTDEDPTK